MGRYGTVKRAFLSTVAIFLLLPLSSHAQGKESNEIPLDHFYAERKKRPFRLVLSKFTGSMGLGYSGASGMLITPTLHYEFNRYRVGIGYTYEYIYAKSLHPADIGGGLSRYFGLLGVSFHRWKKFLLTAELRVGMIALGEKFAGTQANTSIYVNGGVRAEYEFSEYMKVFLRPAFEFTNYTLLPPGKDANVTYNLSALQISLGVSYRLPELPRCFHSYCRVQIDHAHDNKEYRSRVHTPFEKQNPGYGENYREPKSTKKKHKSKKKKRKHGLKVVGQAH